MTAAPVRHVEVRRGIYRDSVALMEVSRTIGALDGVVSALVAMATDLNLEVLADLGFDTPSAASPNDLVIAVAATDSDALDTARSTLEAALEAGPESTGGDVGLEPPMRSVASAARRRPATVALISVPGPYAFADAMDALEAGLPVMIFSDNVPVEQEIRLKDEANRRGLLVMGPDCGTAVIAGVGLGFANVTQPGPVGIIAAAGTGAQQLMCLLAAADTGISHCLGVGGRDLSAPVAGRSTLQALQLLDADPGTEVIVVISKPPDPSVVAEIKTAAARIGKPVVLTFGPSLTEIAGDVLTTLGKPAPTWPRWVPDDPIPRRSGALRGLYSGGTLRDEAYAIARPRLGTIAVDDVAALGHLLIDFGDDRFTAGRPHPMIDPSLRADRLRKDLSDPATGVIIVDVVLGRGAHPSPASVIAEAITDASADGSIPPVVAALVGTPGDPQGLDTQAAILTEVGVRTFLSHAEAVECALDLLLAGGVA